MRLEMPHWVAGPVIERSLYGPGLIWGAGAAAPAGLAVYACICIGSARAVMMGYAEPFVLYGPNAVIFGVSMLAMAVLLHGACFWDSLFESTRTCARIKLTCIIVMGVCAYALCFRMLSGAWV